MQYSSDFTKVMREAGYIYPFDWRRRRMDQEPQGIPISVDDWIDKRERYIAQRIFDWEHFYAHVVRYNKLIISLAKQVKDNVVCFARNSIKNVQRR